MNNPLTGAPSYYHFIGGQQLVPTSDFTADTRLRLPLALGNDVNYQLVRLAALQTELARFCHL